MWYCSSHITTTPKLSPEHGVDIPHCWLVTANTVNMNETRANSTLPVLLHEGMGELQRDFIQEEQEAGGTGTGAGTGTGDVICYLDHAGATLASRRQLQDVFRALAAAPLSNPHSVLH